MKSIGILVYGEVKLAEVIKSLNLITNTKGIDYTKYEIVIRQSDNESFQKIGYWVPKDISDYISKLSPNIYNLFIDRPDLVTWEEQRIEVLKYIKSVNGLMIIIVKSDYEIPENELELIKKLDPIIISV